MLPVDRIVRSWPLALLIAALLSAGCAESRKPVRLRAAPLELARADHVVIVVVDGLRADGVAPLLMPKLHTRLLEESAYTLEARTVRPGKTLPAHTSLVTGLTPQQHGVEWNSHRPELLPIEMTTIFDVAHQAGRSTAIFAGKTKLLLIAPPDALDRRSICDRDNSEILIEALEHIVEEQPQLTLIHLPDTDRVGHRHGWMSKKQFATLNELDQQLAQLFAQLTELRRSGSWALILTADHGGSGFFHGGGTPEESTVPWMVWGDGVEPRELEPLSLLETAPTALRILELKP